MIRKKPKEAPVTVPQLAEMAGVDQSTINRAIREGHLKAWRRGPRGRWKIEEKEAQRWLNGSQGTSRGAK